MKEKIKIWLTIFENLCKLHSVTNSKEGSYNIEDHTNKIFDRLEIKFKTDENKI